MHKRISRAVIHFSWFILVSAIVITTLFVSLIWLTSSSVDDLRPTILEWVQTTTGQPIEVDNLAVEWRGIVPHLKLAGIEVFDRNSHKTLTHLDQASLSVDLYHSILNWKVTIGYLELSGLNVELLHKKDGTISLLELTTQTTSGDEFTQWLLEQPHLKISNSQIAWHELEQQSDPIKLSNVGLELTNKLLTNTHQLSGTSKLANNVGDIEFQLNMSGDPLTSDWDAVLELTIKEFNFSSYLPADINKKIQVAMQEETISFVHSRLNSSTQINWNKAVISNIQGQFSLKNPSPIYSVSGKFRAKQTPEKSWFLTVPDLTIAVQDHQWQPFSTVFLIPLGFSPENPSIDIEINNLRIDDLVTLAPESIQNNIENFQPKGELDNLQIQLNKQNNQRPLLIDGKFSGVESLPYEKIPGFKNISGKFQSNGEVLLIDFDSHNLVVTSLSQSGELEPSIKLDSLVGELNWRKLDQGWVVSTPQFTLLNPNLEFQLTGLFKKDTLSSRHLELQGTFFRGNIEPVVKSIPSNLLNHKVKKWLDHAIVSGHLTGGNVLFRGSLDNFPFENDQQGLFEVRLNAEDGILDYLEGWPRIEGITAEVVFNSHQMIITSPSAIINAVNVSNTTVEIPELNTKSRHLLINGNAIGKMKDGLQFINNSPLKSSIGKQLAHLQISGILDLDLDIDIPLSRPVESKVKGEIHLKKNSLLLESLNIQVNALNGDFIFDQVRWKGRELKARLYESAVSINLDIDKSKASVKSDVRLSGLADKNYITNRMIQLGMAREDLKVLDSVHGTTTWQAQLSLPPGIGDPDGETGLLITSGLKGLSIHGPEPIGKQSNEERPLIISTILSKNSKRQIDFEYGDIVKGKIELSTKKNKTGLKKIALHFGHNKLSNIKNNKHLIALNGNIQNLELSAWLVFFDKYFDFKNSQSEPNENLLKFDLAIAHLKAFGQSFENSHVIGRSSKKTWELQVEDIGNSGMLSIPYQFSNQPVKADFERLKIVTSNNTENSKLNPEKFPELILTSQQFKYNDLQLGSLQLHSRPEKDGIHIEKLVLSSPIVTVDVTGDWKERNREQSNFFIFVNSQALSPMLEQFGFDSSGIEGGKTSISIDASWKGSPADFSLTKLKGDLKLDVGSGRFTEIDNRVGKVFGLLSIHSLGRRLSLDFNDLFKEGFSFDKISASFDLEHGNAYSNDFNMIGSSASIDVTGRIGLSAQDYDQLITVTPSVADSLPIASALFGPIGAGVGAAIFVAGKVIPVLPETIDKVLERQYSLKGSWEEPLIKPLIVTNKKQGGEGSLTN